MIVSGKPPRVLKVVKNRFWQEDGQHIYGVCITRYQLMKLPYWVRDKMAFTEDENNSRHVWTRLLATDPLQALTRFNKLWAGLPKE